MAKLYLWKALRAGLTSQHDRSKWQIGKWRKLDEPPTVLCEGFNASPRVIDAMQYVIMEILAKVEVKGKVIKGDDKWTCQEMRVVEAWEWPKEESVRLAIFAAELVLENFEKQYPGDQRPRETIEAAKKWLKKPSRSAVSAAWAAAWSAESAAWSAWAAESAAWSAAWAAAWAAAWSAAWAAARDEIEAYIQSRIPELKRYQEGG